MIAIGWWTLAFIFFCLDRFVFSQIKLFLYHNKLVATQNKHLRTNWQLSYKVLHANIYNVCHRKHNVISIATSQHPSVFSVSQVDPDSQLWGPRTVTIGTLFRHHHYCVNSRFTVWIAQCNWKYHWRSNKITFMFQYSRYSQWSKIIQLAVAVILSHKNKYCVLSLMKKKNLYCCQFVSKSLLLIFPAE